MEDRTRRNLNDEDIERITGTYRAWRGDGGSYEDVPGFCKSASLTEITAHGFVLTPGRYVGWQAENIEEETVGVRIARLSAMLNQQFEESNRLNAQIRANLLELENGK